MIRLMPCATWSDDCQGKKDYDGRLLSISCRYYPGPDDGGTMTYDTATGMFGTAPYGPSPSAHASIVLNHGTADETVVWREIKITGDTEAAVKASVERWVAERFAEVQQLLGQLG